MEKTTGKNRDEFGKFVKGQTGNPKGRPVGAGISVVTELKRQLLGTVGVGKDRQTILQLLVKKIIEKAVQDGDTRLIIDIIDRIDGKTQTNLLVDLEQTVNHRHFILEVSETKTLTNETETEKFLDLHAGAIEEKVSQ